LEDLENLIFELQAPIKTFRIFAIEKAIKSGASLRLVEVLRQSQMMETDPECAMLLEHAISSVQERLQKKEGQAANRVTLADFARLSVGDQILVIKKTSAGQFKRDASLEAIKKLLAMAAHDVVRAEIVKKCGSFWPDNYQSYLEENLFSAASTLQLACLEAVISRSSDLLIKHFERLVTSPDPLIRAIAIRGLARKHPRSAATFLADSLRRGDYFSRLAALRAISVMNFAQHRASLLELLAHEQDERLLKIAASIVLANPDREVPFRICDIAVKTSAQAKAAFLFELQKNCCSMIRMAELCPDYQMYIVTLKKYRQVAVAKLFVENCLSIYESSQEPTRKELIQLLREKCRASEVLSVAKAVLEKNPDNELLVQALAKNEPAIVGFETETTESGTVKEQNDNQLLRQLIRIRSAKDAGALEKIETAMNDRKADGALFAAALRAATSAGDNRWKQRALSFLRRDDENLQAAALEYLSVHDNDSFMLQVRIFVKSPSLIVRTALLRSLCRQHPDDARDLFQAMLADKDRKVREKAMGSLIHFEFSGVREMLTSYLEREKDEVLLRAGVAFYLHNPMVESVYDLRLLEQNRPEHRVVFGDAASQLIDTLSELGVAAENEVQDFVEQRQKDESERVANEEKRNEERRIESLTRKISWQSVQETLSELSPLYPVLKMVFLFSMLVLGVMFFLAGSGEEERVVVTQGYQPVVSEVGDYLLIVQKVGLDDGAVLATDEKRERYLLLPRPGKAFRVRPGDRLQVKALPFRRDPDGVLIVKTLEISNAR
jgi:hypothetical protein